jgi:hypothetical protein
MRLNPGPCLKQPVVTLGQAPELSSLSPNGTLLLRSHGAPGRFSDEHDLIPFETVVAALLDPHRGLPPTFQGIILLQGCQLGLRPAKGGPEAPTLVERLAGALAADGRGGLEIMGALGNVITTGRFGHWGCVTPLDVEPLGTKWADLVRLNDDLQAFFKGTLGAETRRELTAAGIEAELYGAHPRLGDHWVRMFGWYEEEVCPPSERWFEATLRDRRQRFNGTERFGRSRIFAQPFEERYQCLALPLLPDGSGRWNPCRKAPALERTGAERLRRAQLELLEQSPSGLCAGGWAGDLALVAPTVMRYLAAGGAIAFLWWWGMAKPPPEEEVALDALEAGTGDQDLRAATVPLLSE